MSKMGRGVFARRMTRLAKELRGAKLDGAVVVPGPNMRYLTGVESLLMERPFLLLVPARGTPNLVAPALEAGPYRRCAVELEIHHWTDSQGPAPAIADATDSVGLKGRWGVEGRAPFLFLHELERQSTVELEDAEPVLQGVRELKDDEEVVMLKRSARILSRAFDRFPDFICKGMTERELAKKAVDAIQEQGATGILDVLVQSGERAADPHSLASGRKVRRGESIVIDISSSYQGYYADITRTFCLGRSRKVEEVYARVLEAEKDAVLAAGDGVEVGAVDRAARHRLREAGLGEYFTHRTGHGLGLEVHEAPYIVEGGHERLANRMFFTVEPGAYLPGKLGVRIEDDVTIQGKRPVEITDPPKEFGWWQ
jgi:Xaa-Pro aminopeptidase